MCRWGRIRFELYELQELQELGLIEYFIYLHYQISLKHKYKID